MSSGDIFVLVPTKEGEVVVTNSVGRCEGEGCKRTGGGMVTIDHTEPYLEGIETQKIVRLCGGCLAARVFG